MYTFLPLSHTFLSVWFFTGTTRAARTSVAPCTPIPLSARPSRRRRWRSLPSRSTHNWVTMVPSTDRYNWIPPDAAAPPRHIEERSLPCCCCLPAPSIADVPPPPLPPPPPPWRSLCRSDGPLFCANSPVLLLSLRRLPNHTSSTVKHNTDKLY